MKIVAIMGSPHRGNTLEMTQCFEKELKRHGEVDFEYIHLKDADLRPCRGCFTCFVRGEENCPLQDDQTEIARKLDEADGVVFVSPVYAMHVSYLFKLFVDRFAYTFHRPRYVDKYAVVLAVTGGVGLDETLEYLQGSAMAMGFAVVDRLGYIAPPKNTSLRALMSRKDRTAEVARTFYQTIKQRRPRKLTFKDYLHFKAMREVYRRLETMSPVDYAYWRDQGWFDDGRSYFTDNVRGNPLKSMLVGIMAWQMGRSLDKQIAASDD